MAKARARAVSASRKRTTGIIMAKNLKRIPNRTKRKNPLLRKKTINE